MSMLKKVPQKEDNDVWENEGEWAIEKAPLLRTQSEYIPRYAQPVLEVIKTSAKPLKQKDIVFDKSEFQFLASKLKERRKVLI